MKKAFTLIELLIVVAIIAILAAIAVPNFLEAQTRAKVSRAKSDMRTLATAIEAYRVDNNGYPMDNRQVTEMSDAGLISLTSTEYYPNQVWQVQLTNPVAYLRNYNGEDPFQQHTEERWAWAQTYTYRHHEWRRKYIGHPSLNHSWKLWPLDNEFLWSLDSPGPQGMPDPPSGADITQFLGGYQAKRDMLYDPTNGTISYGHIILTNKGIMSSLPPQQH